MLAVHAQPGARRDALCGLYGERIKIALAAPAVDGKANAALRAFLAKRLGAPKSSIDITAGQTSRSKRVLIKNAAADDIAAALAVAVSETTSGV